MTTIVYDGKTLAGDTLGVRGGDSKFYMDTKVFKIIQPTNKGNIEVLYGSAGYWEDVLVVKQWIQDGMLGSDKPEIFKERGFSGLYITKEGAFRLEDRLFPIPLYVPYGAIGGGREYALAALHLGKNAVEAVEVACHFDLASGGKITSVSFE